METYDVVIVGAGMVGSFAADMLSKKNVKILVVEKRKKLGFHSTIVTYEDVIKKYSLKDHIIIHYDKLSYKLFPEGDERIGTEGMKGVKCGGSLIDCEKSIKSHSKEAKKRGAKFLLGEEVSLINKEGDLYCLTLKNSKKTLHTKLIIDSSGDKCVVSKLLNIYREPKDKEYCYWYLTEHDNIKDPNHAYFEIDDFTRWYWIYPLNKRKSYVGVSNPTALSTGKAQNLIKKYLLRYKDEYSSAKITERGTGIYYNQIPNKRNSIVYGNILFLGEAGGTDTPMMGEGLRPGIILAEILSEHLKKILSGKEKLKVVEKRFYDTVGKSFPLRKVLNSLLVQVGHEDAKEVFRKVLMKVTIGELYNFQLGKNSTKEYLKFFNLTLRSLTPGKLVRLTPFFYEVVKDEIKSRIR